MSVPPYFNSMCDQNWNIRFVKEVEKRQVLYNYKLPDYSRKIITEQAWQEVGDIVGISVAQCKEKWRNLRTVLMRKLKLQPSGSESNTKPYYLIQHMQFYLPFTRALIPAAVGIEIADDLESKQAFDDATPSASSEPVLFPHNIPVLPQYTTQSSTASFTSSRDSREKSAAYADNCVADYFAAKKAKLEATNQQNKSQIAAKRESLRMFLLSLLPELEELSDAQIKLFKRRIFSVIDEISTPS